MNDALIELSEWVCAVRIQLPTLAYSKQQIQIQIQGLFIMTITK